MDQKTIRAYNHSAKEYDDETIDFWKKFPRTFFDKFAKLAKGKVLSIGSGPGRDGIILKEAGIDVTCLDASKAMVKLSEEKGLRSVLGDFNALPFDNNSFEGIWAYTSLLHVPKSEIWKALAEIKRVLKNDGVFGLGLIEGQTEEYKESSVINMPRWFSFYNKKEIDELLRKHGFKIVHFEEFKPKSKNYLNFIAKKKQQRIQKNELRTDSIHQ